MSCRFFPTFVHSCPAIRPAERALEAIDKAFFTDAYQDRGATGNIPWAALAMSRGRP
jgi:hypothetical protein